MIRGCKYVCYKSEGKDKEREEEYRNQEESVAKEEGKKLKAEVSFLEKKMADMISRMNTYEMEKIKSTMTQPVGQSWAEMVRLPNRGDVFLPRGL